MRMTYYRIKEMLRYAETLHIEFISVLGSLFFFPDLVQSCEIQEDILQYFFYCTGMVGAASLYLGNIRWRYLHVQYMLVTFLVPLFTIVHHNMYHPLHLKLILFQIILSVYLVWRIGTEKRIRVRMERSNG